MIFGGIISFLFFILIVILTIAFIRWALKGGRHGNWPDHEKIMSAYDSALEILKERYAKGEIKKEEFEEKKKDLME